MKLDVLKDRSNLFLFVLGVISSTALLPELDIPYLKVDLFNLTAPMAGLFLIAYNYKTIKNSVSIYKKEFVLIFLFLLVLFLSSISSYDSRIAIKHYVKYFEVIIVFFGIVFYIESDEDVKAIFRFYLSSVIFLALVAILIYIFPNFFKNILFVHKIGLQFLPRNESLMSNPNVYGVFSAVICITSLTLLKEKFISKNFAILSLIASVFGILAAGSLNGFFTIMVCLCLFLYISQLSIINKIILITGSCAAVILLLLTILFFIRGQLDNRINIQGAYNSIFHGSLTPRLELWKGVIKSLNDTPFLGTGPSVYNHYFNKYTKLTGQDEKNIIGAYNSHNLFLQILAESGIIGFAIFLSIFILIFRLFKKRKYYIAIPFLALLFGQLFDCIVYDYFFLVFFISLLAIAIYENRKCDENAQIKST
ncbi:MAG: O-antigen ligase family protein [Spirochaetota bacterium]|nr:O-antigen ligase family protein [Spirochaetota bacterium]